MKAALTRPASSTITSRTSPDDSIACVLGISRHAIYLSVTTHPHQDAIYYRGVVARKVTDNRNHQYTFLAMLITLKWSDHRMVPDFTDIDEKHDISQRTMERVRAKMRRLGLIDRVSRFNARYGGQEGWVLSTRFERSLTMLADKIEQLKDTDKGSQDKDMLMLQYAEARREIRNNAQGGR